ncbi:MAG: hypothetical protein P0S94_00365, partial [Simkaniaceae bacterium]|nr:hypothetical protein [Simkaniaceae bacterium]
DETPFDKDLLERIVADSDKLTPESRSALIVYAAGTRETLSLNVMHALCKTSEPRGQLDKLTVTYEMLKEDKFKEIATHYKPQIARVLYAQQSIDGADLAALTSHLSLVDPNKVKDLTFEQWAALPQNHREKFIHQITDIASLSLEKLPRYMSDTEVNALQQHLGHSITEEHCVALLSICFSARLLKRLPRKCINDLLTKDFVMKHLKYKGEELVKAGYTYNWLAEVPLNDDSIQYLPEILTHLEFGDAHKHFWALALQDKVKVNTSSGEDTYLYMLKKIANRKGCNLTKDEVKLALPQDGEPSIVPLDHLANAFIKLSDDCTPDLIEGVSAQHTNPLLPLLANGVPNRAVWAEALDAQHSPFAACFKGENTRAQKSVNYNLSLFTTQQKNTLAYEPPHPSNFDFRSLSDLQMFVDVIGGITSPNKLDEAQKINQTNVITHFLSTLTKERAADHRHAILILQLISHLVAKHPTVPVFSIVNSQYTDFLTDHRCEALEPHVANLKQVINDNPTRKPFNYDRSSLGKLLETTFKEVAPKLY